MLENSQKTIEEKVQEQQSDGGDMNFRSNSSTTAQHQTQSWDPLYDYSDTPVTSPASTGGIFSSVYDVVSLLNGSSSFYTGSSSDSSSPKRERPRRLSVTTDRLVDTLYLF